MDEARTCMCIYTRNIAQGGGGSFKDRFDAVNDGRQSKPTDGLASGWGQRSVVGML